MHTRPSFGVLFENGGGETSIAGKMGSYGKFLAGAEKAPPGIFLGGGPQEKTFAGPAAKPSGKQPCRQDRGRVSDQAIPRAQKFRQVGEDMVCDCSTCPVDDEQARLVTFRSRSLRDQFLWQWVVKKFGGERWRHVKRAMRHGIAP